MATKALYGPRGPKTVVPYSGPAGTLYGISVKQGATDGSCLAVTGSGQKCIGIVEHSDVTNSGNLDIVLQGETIGISGAAIVADTECIVDANGNLIASTTQGDFVVGRTRSSATASGQEVVILVAPYIR